jgi:hypothetical protein
MSLLPESEFDGFYRRAYDCDAQAIAVQEDAESKLSDPAWYPEVLCEVAMDAALWRLFIARDDLAFCRLIRERFAAEAQAEAARDAA